MDAGGVQRLQELLRVAVRKVQREPADLVRLGNPTKDFLILLINSIKLELGIKSRACPSPSRRGRQWPSRARPPALPSAAPARAAASSGWSCPGYGKLKI